MNSAYSHRVDILTLNLSQSLDQLLQFALRNTDFHLDYCGSDIAAIHKLNAGKASLLLLENRRMSAQSSTIEDIIARARLQSLPIIFVSDQILPELHRHVMSFYMQIVEPPLYPYRLLQFIKRFQWLEDTVYVMRKPREAAKKFQIQFIAQTDARQEHGQAFLQLAERFFKEQGNAFASYNSWHHYNQANHSNPELVLLYVTEPAQLESVFDQISFLQQRTTPAAIVPVVAKDLATSTLVAKFLNCGVVTVLADVIEPEDLITLYQNLSFLRTKSTL